MKRLLRSWGVLLALFVCAMASVHTSAAVDRPDAVKKLWTVKMTETTATLKWSEAADADGYYLYLNNEDGSRKLIASPTERKYTVTGIKPGQSYEYQVYAYKVSGGKKYKSKEGSPVVVVEPEVTPPKQVKNFRVTLYGDLTAYLAWDKTDNTNYYVIYQYNEKKDKYVKMYRTRETTYKLTGLKDGKTYIYAIRAYRTFGGGVGALSEFSEDLEVTGRAMKTSDIHGRWWKAVVNANVKVKNAVTGERIKVLKGTSVQASKQSTGTVTVLLPTGVTATMSGKYLTFGGGLAMAVSYDYYSTRVKEQYVNTRRIDGQLYYSSNTNWMIWISQYTGCVTVFQGSTGKWKAVREMPCVFGADGHTPPGKFSILAYPRETVNGRPVIYFTWNEAKYWGNAFHCRVDGNTWGPYSHGCVRLADSDLYFIANNCPVGTTVISN